MKYSVIIPMYNAEKHIGKAIESVNEIFDNNVEIIVVDDCSIDNSQEQLKLVVEKKGYQNIKVIKNSENKGVSYSRNAGFNTSTGDYIIFLDSDDTLSSSFYKIIQEKMDLYPDIDIIRFSTNRNNDRFSDVIIKKFKEIPIQFIRSFYLHSSCTQLLKRNVLKNIRFNEKLIFGEDMLLSFEALSVSKKTLLISDQLYQYNFNIDSVSNRLSITQIEEIIKSITTVYNEILKKIEDKKIRNIYKLKYNKEISIQLFKMRRIDKQRYYENLKKTSIYNQRLKESTSVYLVHSFLIQKKLYNIADLLSACFNILVEIKRKK